ncbi:MAG: type III-A CRISPR-associated RAMP protein Csm4 [Syntrophomonadales bacterium]
MEFTTALHIGNDSGSATLPSAEMTIHSDTLFSALCIEAIQAGGDALLQQLYELARSGKIILSDLFPYRKENYFIPKPILKVESSPGQRDIKERKAYKNLKYIAAASMNDYLASLTGKTEFDVKKANELLAQLAVSEMRQLVSIKGQKETQPYHVGCLKFNRDSGLYLIAAYEREEDLSLITRLLKALSLSGIGGERSSGLGKFGVETPILLDTRHSEGLQSLAELLNNKESSWQMLLNTALPRDEELDKVCNDGTYMILRRGGFVQSDRYWTHQVKKRLIYAFAPGSCFQQKFTGDIYDVSHEGRHPVYRYLKPLFMGVSI